MFERLCEMRRGKKLRFYKGFRGFGFFPNLGGVTRCQTKRDTKLRETRRLFSCGKRGQNCLPDRDRPVTEARGGPVAI